MLINYKILGSGNYKKKNKHNKSKRKLRLLWQQTKQTSMKYWTWHVLGQSMTQKILSVLMTITAMKNEVNIRTLASNI